VHSTGSKNAALSVIQAHHTAVCGGFCPPKAATTEFLIPEHHLAVTLLVAVAECNDLRRAR
jgi:hypothetical protein